MVLVPGTRAPRDSVGGGGLILGKVGPNFMDFRLHKQEGETLLVNLHSFKPHVIYKLHPVLELRKYVP